MNLEPPVLKYEGSRIDCSPFVVCSEIFFDNIVSSINSTFSIPSKFISDHHIIIAIDMLKQSKAKQTPVKEWPQGGHENIPKKNSSFLENNLNL